MSGPPSPQGVLTAGWRLPSNGCSIASRPPRGDSLDRTPVRVARRGLLDDLASAQGSALGQLLVQGAVETPHAQAHRVGAIALPAFLRHRRPAVDLPSVQQPAAPGARRPELRVVLVAAVRPRVVQVVVALGAVVWPRVGEQAVVVAAVTPAGRRVGIKAGFDAGVDGVGQSLDGLAVQPAESASTSGRQNSASFIAFLMISRALLTSLIIPQGYDTQSRGEPRLG